MLSLFLHILGVFIVLYMLRMDMKDVIDRPLFWTEITMTIGTFFGAFLIGLGFYFR